MRQTLEIVLADRPMNRPMKPWRPMNRRHLFKIFGFPPPRLRSRRLRHRRPVPQPLLRWSGDGPFRRRALLLPDQPQDKGLAELLRWQLGGGRKDWPERFESPFRDTPRRRCRTAGRLVGHATLLIQAAGLNILTDPVFVKRASPVSFAGPKR